MSHPRSEACNKAVRTSSPVVFTRPSATVGTHGFSNSTCCEVRCMRHCTGLIAVSRAVSSAGSSGATAIFPRSVEAMVHFEKGWAT